MFGSIIGSAADLVVLVLLFGVTIFVHELGHFLLALLFKMRVDTFAIGFGPPIWKRTVRGITYKIGWIPVGGYVALPQLDPAAMSAVQGKDKDAGEEDGAPAKPVTPAAPWKRIVVSVSGAAGNVAFAFLLAWIIYLAPPPSGASGGGDTLIGFVSTNSAAYEAGLRTGDRIVAVNDEVVDTWHDYSVLCTLGAGGSNVVLTVQTDGERRQVRVPVVEADMGVAQVEGVARSMLCIVSDVLPGGSAEEAGLEVGDRITQFNGERVASTQHFIRLVAGRAGEPTPIAVERDGEERELTVIPRYDRDQDRALIGVTVSPGFENAMPWMQYRNPLDQLKNDAMGIVRILRALVTPKEAGQAAKGLGGPIMIFTALWMSIKVSMLNAVGFLRFLNVNLAILNLLPIPVLDGGHVLFALWEGVTRRKVHPKVANALVNVFAALLIGVLVLLSLRDVWRAPRFFRALRRDQSEEADRTAAPTNDTEDAGPAAPAP